jgi:hypothetical protein
VIADHPVIHRRLLEGRQILALKVLDDRDLERRVVVDVLDEGGQGLEPGGLRCTPATLARDQLIAIRAEWTDQDRLEHAVLSDRGGQLVERGGVEDDPRLLGVRFDVGDRDHPDTRRPSDGVGGDEADDRW